MRRFIPWILSLLLAFNPVLAELAKANEADQASKERMLRESQAASEEFEEIMKSYLANLGGVPVPRFELDDFQLLPQNAIRKGKAVKDYDVMVIERKTQFVNWWNVDVRFGELFSTQKSLSFENASGYAPAKKHGSDFHCEGFEPCSFYFHHSKTGRRLNAFNIAVTSAVLFGPYMVFLQPGSYNAETQTQTISVIDVDRFNHHIANDSIPIFSIPLKTDSAIERLSVQKGYISLDGRHAMTPGQLDSMSQVGEMAFNLTANSVDPETVTSAYQIIGGLKTYLYQLSIKSASGFLKKKALEEAIIDTGQILRQVKARIDAEKALGGKISNWQSANLTLEKLKQTGRVQKAISGVSATLHQGQTVKVKMHALTKRLLSPKPYGSVHIKRAIAMVVAGTNRALGVKPAKLLANLAKRKRAGAGILAATAAAYVLPESYLAFQAMGLDVGHQALNHVSEVLRAGGLSYWRAFSEVSSIVYNFPGTVYEGLIGNGQWKQLLVGLSFLMVSLAGVLGIYHVTQNTRALIRDRRSPDWQGLVHRQEKLEAQYLQALSSSEAQNRKTSDKFSPEDAETVEKLIREYEGRKKGVFTKMMSRISSGVSTLGKVAAKAFPQSLKKQVQKIKEAVKNSKKSFAERNSDQIQVAKAIIHLYLSHASYSKTVHQYTGIWNFWSGLRYSSMRWRYAKVGFLKIPLLSPTPMLLTSRIIYPNIFERTVAEQRLPNRYNGGTSSLPQISSLYFQRARRRWRDFKTPEERARQKSKEKASMARSQQILAGVEKPLVKLAFEASLKALVENMTDQKELRKILTAKGAKRITDSTIRRMNYKNKLFLRLHFEKLYALVMEKAMVIAIKNQRPEYDVASDQSSKKTIKDFRETDWTDLTKPGFHLGHKDIEEIFAETLTQQGNEVLAYTKKEVKKIIPRPKHIGTHYKHEMAGDLDPHQDGSIARYHQVQEKRKNPLALARAVRAEVSELFITLPTDIAFLLLLTAGITEGVMKPLTGEFWGPNSTAFLSHYSFYGGMVSGVAMGILANSWVKLQEDARHDDAGNLGQVPRGKDAERSYLSWFWKQANQRDNSMWKNWKYVSTLVWYNIPALLLNFALFDLLFLGFFDIDQLVLGLALGFLLPNNPFSLKIEQGFEKSAYYDAKIFPERLIAHPRAQKYIMRMSQKRRNRFNLIFDVFRNFDGMILKTATLTPIEGYPNRAWSRAIFGSLLAEKIINGANGLAASTQTVPGINKVTTGLSMMCEALFSHTEVITPKK